MRCFTHFALFHSAGMVNAKFPSQSSYGFEIVHDQHLEKIGLKKRSIRQLKIYAKQNDSNFNRRENRRFIRI